ncbi:Proteolipid membrane putative modulator family protein [Brugia pahangi]
MSADTDKIVEVLLIIILPPLAIWHHERKCAFHLFLNILLTVFRILPIVIYTTSASSHDHGIFVLTSIATTFLALLATLSNIVHSYFCGC